VPAGAWLAPGYAEWPAPLALRDAVACLWASVVPADADADVERTGLVLPDACSDLIWERGTGLYVAGPDTGPLRIVSPPGTVFAGVRFRPGAGGAALGLPLSEIRDQRVALADLLPAAAGRVPDDADPATAAEWILDVAGTLIVGGTPDPVMTGVAVMLREPSARVEDVAAETGLSMRQLRRRSHAAAGYGPKTLQRVLRFQRFVQRIDAPAIGKAGEAGGINLAAVAAEAGYADQAHLTRDCKALSGMTPTALARARRSA
jgi:AraC-like DNA-binding protein